MTKAVYPGSFDPVTNGHLDILTKATSIFDTVIIAVAINREKDPLITIQDRITLIKDAVRLMPNVEVGCFDGLTVEYAKSRGASVIIRGLRAVSDYEMEIQMSHMNHSLDPQITTVFFPSSNEYAFLSSSVVRDVAALGGDVSAFVPKNVNDYLKKLYKGVTA